MNTAPVTRPAVEVIVPFRDQGLWLLQACLSLQQQTFPHWRALLVNDGSKPVAVAAAERLAEADGRFRLIHLQQPKTAPGPWLARNLGIKTVKAPLVAFLDADDLWHPRKLELQLPLHGPHSGVLSVCSYHRFQASSLRVLETRHPPHQLTFQQLFHRNAIPLSTVIISRDLLTTSGGFMPEHHEDYGLWLRLFAAADAPIYRCLQEPLMAYRLHDQSISAERHRSLLAVNELFRQHLPRRRERWPALLRWGLQNGLTTFSRRKSMLLPEPYRSLLQPRTSNLIEN